MIGSEPAFPINELALNRDADPPVVQQHWGIDIRDYFATAAMQGLLANPGGPVQTNANCGWSFTNCTADDAARVAYSVADAMLAARKVKP